MNVKWTCHIDHPAAGVDFPDPALPISGWVSAEKPVRSVSIRCDKLPEDVARLSARPDVEKANRKQFRHSAGFESITSLSGWLDLEPDALVELVVEFDSSEIVNVPIGIPSMAPVKQRKLERIYNLLACPECREPLEALEGGSGFRCGKCAKTFSHNGVSLDFLSDELKSRFSIEPTGNISCWDYDGRILRIIEESPDGMFLDCGAGWRAKLYENVINYEIQNYPSTDILGVGECLPFADGSLDGVFSVAVLEHVKDPFRCASEIERVLKPGGVLFCAAAFLQPVHAFPHHYYNMTSLGLENLFPGLTVDERDVPLALHPMKTIGWVLRSYAEGLPEDLRKRFMNMSVGELSQLDDFKEMETNPMVQRLDREKWPVLANGTSITARKP